MAIDIRCLAIAPTEGAVSWLNIFGELQARGMEDCFIACVDGLKGLPEAGLSRGCSCECTRCARYVPWKERKPVAGGLRSVYTAPSEEAALAALEAFERQWSEKYPAIAPLWRKDWERLAPFFDYAPAIRKVVYTTNAIESLISLSIFILPQFHFMEWARTHRTRIFIMF